LRRWKTSRQEQDLWTFLEAYERMDGIGVFMQSICTHDAVIVLGAWKSCKFNSTGFIRRSTIKRGYVMVGFDQCIYLATNLEPNPIDVWILSHLEWPGRSHGFTSRSTPIHGSSTYSIHMRSPNILFPRHDHPPYEPSRIQAVTIIQFRTILLPIKNKHRIHHSPHSQYGYRSSLQSRKSSTNTS
jgi:hypothetical protein